MSISANGIFSATTVAATNAWKPTNAAASGAGKSMVASAFAPVGEADSVSLSPLGKALTGAAAKLFEQLDPKARGKLDDLVSAGVLKAEDVVKGLRGIAKEAVDTRYREEAPLTAEEKQQAEAGKAYREKWRAHEEGMTALLKEVSPILHDESFSREPITLPNGERESISDTEKRTKQHEEDIRAAQSRIKAYEENSTKENGALEEPNIDPQNTRLYRTHQNLKRSGLFDGEEDRDIYSKEDRKAVETLYDAGFTRSDYGDGAKKFAAGVDLSDIREVPPSEYPELVQEAPVKKPGENVVPGRPSGVFTNAIPEKTKPFLVSYDVNGNTMVPGWTSSAERQQRPGLTSGIGTESDTTQNDAILSALKDSLKNGAATSERTDTIV